MKKKKSLPIAICIAIGVIASIVAVLFYFPSYQLGQLFLPAVTSADLSAEPNTNFSGRRPSEDIPRLQSSAQYEDGTYTPLTFLTVKTDEIIPLGYYRLKDTSEASEYRTGKQKIRSGFKTLNKETKFLGVNAMYYGQYCLVKLPDGNYITTFLDSGYRTTFGTVTLPVGRADYIGNTPILNELIIEASQTYKINTKYILMMFNEYTYPDFNLLDYGIRILTVVLVVLLELGFVGAFVVFGKRKRMF